MAIPALILLGISFLVGIQYSQLLPEAAQETSGSPKQSTISSKKYEEPYLYKVVKPDVFPVWLTMLVTAGVGVIALKTLGDIKKQTRIGTRSARAALLSAKAVINSERAWLVIGFEQTNNTDTGALPIFKFTCLNQGKTPAVIKRIDAGYRVVNNPWDLPVPASVVSRK
ncbi:MAG: hypothetical protein ABI209_00195 [Edaphobacter sp.]